jgi:hypothetical protein
MRNNLQDDGESAHTRAQTEAVDGLSDLERVHGVHFQRHTAEETTKI